MQMSQTVTRQRILMTFLYLLFVQFLCELLCRQIKKNSDYSSGLWLNGTGFQPCQAATSDRDSSCKSSMIVGT